MSKTNCAPEGSSWAGSTDVEAAGIKPLDEHNIKLLDAVKPKEWITPEVADDFEYDLVAIGAGAGGLVSAKQSARRGARSALIEKHLAGGDCLNVGCVPSKALLKCAKVAKSIRAAATGKYGGKMTGEYQVDFPAVMERMRRLRAVISPADACSTTANVGADIYNGTGVFTGKNTIEIALRNGEKRTIRFKVRLQGDVYAGAITHVSAGALACTTWVNTPKH